MASSGLIIMAYWLQHLWDHDDHVLWNLHDVSLNSLPEDEQSRVPFCVPHGVGNLLENDVCASCRLELLGTWRELLVCLNYKGHASLGSQRLSMVQVVFVLVLAPSRSDRAHAALEGLSLSDLVSVRLWEGCQSKVWCSNSAHTEYYGEK